MRALVLVCGFAGVAHADGPATDPKPDPAAVDAADANLESTARRQGLSLTFAVGGGVTLGFGIDNAVGRGGSGSFRLGKVANSRAVVTLEVAGVALFHAVKTTTGKSELHTNQDSNVLVGMQYYVNPSLWVRGAVGIGGYKTSELSPADEVRLLGPAGAIGAGVDLVRWRRAAIGLEFMTISMINRDGILSSSGFMLDLSVD